MTAEETIVQYLINNYKVMDGKCTIQRERRITAQVPCDMILNVIEYAKEKLSFTMLCAITGLDLGDKLQAIYHMASDNGIILSLKINVPYENPVIKSVTRLFCGASFYERELSDMFGFVVLGTPPGRRYPLPDWWPEDQYPLRKDWKPENLTGGVQKNE